MATYEWVCNECTIFWDRECSLGKAPDRTRCPKCKKLSHRYWQQQGVAISFKDDGCGNKGSNASDFHTVKRRYQKHAEDGYDKKSGNTFLHRSIKETRERLEDNSARYKPVYLRPDRLVATGEARKLSDKEQSEKLEKARKLTAQAYDKAKIDPNHETTQF